MGLMSCRPRSPPSTEPDAGQEPDMTLLSSKPLSHPRPWVGISGLTKPLRVSATSLWGKMEPSPGSSPRSSRVTVDNY